MSAHRRAIRDPFTPWCERWALRPDGEPILTIGSSLLPVRCRGTPAMLKVTHEAEERFGAALMVWWDGVGTAAVLAHEGDALLLERAMGTRSLDRLSHAGRAGDNEACRVLCEAIGVLHRPRRGPFPDSIPLDTWFAPLLEGHARYGGVTTSCAAIARGLLAERREPVVLHGDVHHGNVLDFESRGWLAIDPKALHGERAFDYANLFRNGDVARAEPPGRRLSRRLDVVGKAAGLERERLLRWTMAFSGLSSVWLRNDGEEAVADLSIVDLCAAELART